MLDAHFSAVAHKLHAIFDLDDTLADTKQPITPEMARALASLLSYRRVAVISGCAFAQFEKQLLPALSAVPRCRLSALTLLPTCGAAMYVRDGDRWELVYDHSIPADDAQHIIAALERAEAESGYGVDDSYGPKIENRGPQITFSACGQEAPPAVKKRWDPHKEKRRAIIKILTPLLPPGYDARYGGSTSIDITKAGLDKAYGISSYRDRTGDRIETMVFIGDALGPGGNDEAALRTGIHCIAVTDPADTLRLISSWNSAHAHT